MPQRFLRPGIVGSLRLARCSPWAQLLYYKLINLVDDYDRYDAHPTVLGRAAFPYGDPKGRAFTEKQVEEWLVELETARLGKEDDPCITRYNVNGTPYLILHRCTERIRSMTSRYPSPSEDATCWQVLSGVVRCRQMQTHPAIAASTPSSSSSSKSEEPPLIAHGAVEVPDDRTILQFAAAFPGEPASGAPAMPEEWIRGWVAKLRGRTSWPRDWKAMMVADWRAQFRGWLASPKKGAEKRAPERWQTEKDLASIREQILTHPKRAWPANKPLPEKMTAEFDGLVMRRKVLEKELAS